MLYFSIAIVIIAALWVKWPPKVSINISYTPHYPENPVNSTNVTSSQDLEEEEEPTPKAIQEKQLADMAALINNALFGGDIK